MPKDDESPSPWRSARSSLVNSMAAQGRAPSFNSRGQVRGFRSRPGAPLAANDSMSNLGVVAPLGSADHDSAWKAFFAKSTPPTTAAATPPVPPAIDPMPGYPGFASMPGAAPVTPDDHYSASMAANTTWMNRNAAAPATPAGPSIQTYTGDGGTFKRVGGLPSGQFASSTFVPGQNSPWNLTQRRSQFGPST